MASQNSPTYDKELMAKAIADSNHSQEVETVRHWLAENYHEAYLDWNAALGIWQLHQENPNSPKFKPYCTDGAPLGKS